MTDASDTEKRVLFSKIKTEIPGLDNINSVSEIPDGSDLDLELKEILDEIFDGRKYDKNKLVIVIDVNKLKDKNNVEHQVAFITVDTKCDLGVVSYQIDIPEWSKLGHIVDGLIAMMFEQKQEQIKKTNKKITARQYARLGKKK